MRSSTPPGTAFWSHAVNNPPIQNGIMVEVDALIIGQGLAGSLLAWELRQHGQSILVLDVGTDNASSVAAGIINPVTGLRLAMQTHVETLLPAAQNFYSALKAYFNETFFIELPMRRLIASEDEYLLRAKNDAITPHIKTLSVNCTIQAKNAVHSRPRWAIWSNDKPAG